MGEWPGHTGGAEFVVNGGLMINFNPIRHHHILPPSHDELERRLRNRAQDTHEVVAGRMAKAADEISHWAEYDYIILNENVFKALEEIKAILVAERLRRSRQVGIPAFVESLTR